MTDKTLYVGAALLVVLNEGNERCQQELRLYCERLRVAEANDDEWWKLYFIPNVKSSQGYYGINNDLNSGVVNIELDTPEMWMERFNKDFEEDIVKISKLATDANVKLTCIAISEYI